MPRGKQLPDDVIERLVGLVRERPFIYDAKDDTHMDAQKMSNAWESIAKTLKVEGLDGKAWRAKWKNMRDTYMKQRRLMKEKKSGDAAKKVNKWKFYDMVSFLEPYIAENEVDTNVPDVEDTDTNDSYTGPQSVHEDNRSEVSSFSENLPVETEASSVSTTPSTSTGRVCQTPKRSGKRHLAEDTSSIELALTDFINESRKSQEQLEVNVETDPDEVLFVTYAKRMKELTKEKQAFIKLQMSQLFFNAENGRGIQIPVTPLPPGKEVAPSFGQNDIYSNQHQLQISTHYEDKVTGSQNEGSAATSDLLSAAMHMTFQ